MKEELEKAIREFVFEEALTRSPMSEITIDYDYVADKNGSYNLRPIIYRAGLKDDMLGVIPKAKLNKYIVKGIPLGDLILGNLIFGDRHEVRVPPLAFVIDLVNDCLKEHDIKLGIGDRLFDDIVIRDSRS